MNTMYRSLAIAGMLFNGLLTGCIQASSEDDILPEGEEVTSE